MGNAVRDGTAGLAYRMLRDEHAVPRRDARYSRRRRRPDLSAPRRRDRPERGCDREDVLALLATRATLAGCDRRKDVQTPSQLFHGSRSPRGGLYATTYPLCAADGRALSESARFFIRAAQGGGQRGEAAG